MRKIENIKNGKKVSVTLVSDCGNMAVKMYHEGHMAYGMDWMVESYEDCLLKKEGKWFLVSCFGKEFEWVEKAKKQPAEKRDVTKKKKTRSSRHNLTKPPGEIRAKEKSNELQSFWEMA